MAKNQTDFTKQSKNTTDWGGASKNTTDFTSTSKNTTDFTKVSKNPADFTLATKNTVLWSVRRDLTSAGTLLLQTGDNLLLQDGSSEFLLQ